MSVYSLQLHEVLSHICMQFMPAFKFCKLFCSVAKEYYVYLFTYVLPLSIYDRSEIHCDNSCLEVAVQIIDHFLVDKFYVSVINTL